MKKHLALLLAVVLVLTVFASCNFTTMAEAQYDYEITSASTSYTVSVGGSLDLKSLFNVENTTLGESVAVTDEMITTDVNFAVAGMYTVTCAYENAVKSVIVIVAPVSGGNEDVDETDMTSPEEPSEPEEESKFPGEEITTTEVATTTPKEEDSTEEDSTEENTTEENTTEEETTAKEETTAPDNTGETVTYTFSNYAAGTQYATDEYHELDDVLSVITNDAHFTSQLRLYCDTTHLGSALFESTKLINGFSVNAGYKDATLLVYGSNDGSSWDLIDEISVSASYDDYTVDMNGEAYAYILLEAEGKQVRVQSVTVTYGESSGNGGGSSGGSSGGGTGSDETYTSGITNTQNGVGSSANSPLHNEMQDYIKNDPSSSDYQLSIGLPAQGTYSALVIPVQFSNDKFTQDELSDLEIAFNGTAAQTGWQSVSSYYTTSSFGKLNLSFDIANPITMPSRSSAYETDEDGAQNILDYALDMIDDTLDLSNYDTNGDGYIDAVYLIYSVAMDYESDESNYWAFVTWHFDSDTYDGVKAHYYLFASVDFMYEEIEGADNGYEGLTINATTYIHETGHLLGLDDYYDYAEGEGSDEGLGGADMMDYTIGDQNVYSKLMLGWVTPTVVNSTTTLTIMSSTETGTFILIPLDYDGTYFSEYLIIDLYTATGLNEFHGDCDYSYLYFDPNDEYEHGAEFGARIYHVSASIDNPYSDDYYSFTDNNNSMSSDPLIKLVEADGDKNFESDTYDGTKYASANDLWQTGDNFSSVQPDYKTHNGAALGFNITFTNVSASGATVKVTFN